MSLKVLKIKEIRDLGDSEDSINEIEDYSKSILTQTSLYTNKYRRLYGHSLKSKNSIKEDLRNYGRFLAWEKLSLFKNERIEFLNSVRFELKDLLSKAKIESIIKNSFAVDALPEPTELLNFEIEKSSDVHKAMYNIYLRLSQITIFL